MFIYITVFFSNYDEIGNISWNTVVREGGGGRLTNIFPSMLRPKNKFFF